jgi:hypothetical protein
MKPLYGDGLLHSTMQRMLREDPEWKAEVKKVQQRLKEDFYGFWQRVFIDKEKQTYPLPETSAFTLCWLQLLGTGIVSTRIVIGQPPSTDHRYNAELFQHPPDSRMDYLGEVSDEGNYHFRWLVPTEFAYNEYIEDGSFEDGTVLIPPGKVRMLVGHAHIYDVMTLLRVDRGLARWPSNDDAITVLKITDPELWTLMPDDSQKDFVWFASDVLD